MAEDRHCDYPERAYSLATFFKAWTKMSADQKLESVGKKQDKVATVEAWVKEQAVGDLAKFTKDQKKSEKYSELQYYINALKVHFKVFDGKFEAK